MLESTVIDESKILEEIQQSAHQALDESDSSNSIFPYDALSEAFQNAIKEYSSLSYKDFEKILRKTQGEKQGNEKDFFDVNFEDLFDIPVREKRNEISTATREQSDGGVFSHGIKNDIGISLQFYSSNNSVSVHSFPQSLPSLIEPVYVNQIETAPVPVSNPSHGMPVTPDILVNAQFTGGKNSEVLLNTFESLVLAGNIFTNFGASFGASAGANANVYFSSFLRPDSSEDRTNSDHVVLITPEGNTLTFYTQGTSDHAFGDFEFELSHAVLTPPLAFTMSGANKIFTEHFLYSLTDVWGGTNVAEFNVQIIDDAPQATNQIAPLVLNEADIAVIGTQGLLVPLELTSSLVVPSVPDSIATPGGVLSNNRFGANGGVVSNVTIVGGNTVFNGSEITVIDSKGNTFLVDVKTGDFTFTLDHGVQNTNNQPYSEVFTYQFTDNEGNKASANYTITINDDAPIATQKENDASETLLFVNGSEIVTGNFITDDDGFGVSLLGADGAAITKVNNTLDSDDGLNDGIIHAVTTYGDITVYITKQGIQNAGDYIYSLDSAKTTPVNDNLMTVVDTISYLLTDGDGSTSASQLNINISLNQPPIANDDVGLVDQAQVLTVVAQGVLSNDTTSIGDTKTVIEVNGVANDIGKQIILPSGALLTLNGDGSYEYNPNNLFEGGGVDNFTYTMEEAEGLTSTATVTITIDAPLANDDSNATNNYTPLNINAAGGVLNNDVKAVSDNTLVVAKVEGQSNQVGIQIALASGALLTLNSDGSYDYDPNGQFITGGIDTFTYQAADGLGGLSNIGTVTITIASDPSPTAVNDAGLTHEGIVLNVNAASGVLSNDLGGNIYDPLVVSAVNGNALDVGNQIALPSGALLTLNSDGSYSYDPNGQFGITGTDSFTYTVTNAIGSDDGTVDLDILVPPIVLDLNDDGFDLVSVQDSQVSWVMANGERRLTGWVGPNDGILVYDKDHLHQVTDLKQIAFAYHHPDAKTDLEGLRLMFDSNQDGIIDPQDLHFEDFAIWQDINQNGRVDEGEWQSLSARHIKAIDLQSDHQFENQSGNVIFGYSSFTTLDGKSHQLADVALKVGALAPSEISLEDVFKKDDELDFSALPLATESQQEMIQVVPTEVVFMPTHFDHVSLEHSLKLEV